MAVTEIEAKQQVSWLDEKTRVGVTPARVLLVLVVALSAALLLTNISALGYANHYYTAAVTSMLKSWHNFFFVAAEPGGSVSVDKPPVGLWLEVLSAAIFGINGFAMVLPQIIAGILSVIVVYHLVQRSFGTAAGLLAALALAITPVVIATDRNNTIDSTLILTLLLAAWAFIKATETSRLRYLLLGVVVVGIGFNIKMLEAFLPLPAFYAVYFLGSHERIWPKVGKLALASLLLVVISFSWAVAVDLTPPDQRPYVGSSGNNSEMSLIFGYNGVDRLLGMFGRRTGGFRAGSPGGFPRSPNGGIPNRVPPNGPGNGNNFFFGQGRTGRPAGGVGGVGFPGGIGDTGRAGPFRLFIPPLSKEVSWLLPFGLLGAVLLLVGARLRWPVAEKHRAMVLWGGWLLTAGIFFSIAGFFHEYYLSTMAPPMAALVGIGAMELWRLRSRSIWFSIALLAFIAIVTLAFQDYTARAFVNSIWWQPIAMALLATGLALLIFAAFRKLHTSAVTGFAFVMAALLITPGIWSGLTNLNSSSNQSLPSAYGGRSYGSINLRGVQMNQQLMLYLQANTQGMKYLMAVPSSMQGADYVIATGRPVLYMGGFMGQDQVVTATSLAQLVSSGQLRYIYWNSNRGGFGNQPGITNWVTSQCRTVTGFDTTTRNSGAPDGTGSGIQGGFQGFGGEMQVALYDCAK
jgi:4-amino-4-deoxy-L-arabinose transferase-like glycosyltransferase